MSDSVADLAFMARAIELAEKGWYSTSPNPRVGCVIVRDGVIIGEGFHLRAGLPHAERNALKNIDARGATAYVTLEPCSHFGRTPPCSDALIEAGVARVVVAMQDPNPQVSGSGLKRLNDAGIETVLGVMEQQAKALNKGFIRRMVSGKPYVTLKLAASMDGRTAMASGESKWISGDDSRRDVQKLRAQSGAVVTGIGTVLADNPSMNVRLAMADLVAELADEAVRQPLRVVLDSQLRISPDATIFKNEGDTLIITLNRDADKIAAIQAAGGEVQLLSGASLDLVDVLDVLANRQINDVMVEAGATLAGAFLAQGLVDETVLYQAPHVMGGNARGLFHLPGLDKMENRIALSFSDVRRIGNDIRITAIPEK